MQNYEVIDLSRVPPIEFRLAGELFRVPRKVPLSNLKLLSAVMLNDEGQRVYAASQIIPNMIAMMAEELFLPWPDDNERGLDDDPAGRWVKVDDRERFVKLLESPRVEIPIRTLGKIAMDIMEEVTAHPTGEPKL